MRIIGYFSAVIRATFRLLDTKRRGRTRIKRTGQPPPYGRTLASNRSSLPARRCHTSNAGKRKPRSKRGRPKPDPANPSIDGTTSMDANPPRLKTTVLPNTALLTPSHALTLIIAMESSSEYTMRPWLSLTIGRTQPPSSSPKS